MARINIENSIFNDHRFVHLIQIEGEYYKALGILIGAWMLAQKHYLNEKNERLIPSKEWDDSMFKNVEKVGLAERRVNGVYLKGSDEQFKWLLQRSNAGKISSQRKKNPNDRTTTVLTRTTARQPLTLTLTPTHTHTTSEEVVVPSNSTQSFENKFLFNEWIDWLRRKNLRDQRIESNIQLLVNRFEEIINLENFVAETQSSKVIQDLWKNSNGSDEAVLKNKTRRYVKGAIVNEIGLGKNS